MVPQTVSSNVGTTGLQLTPPWCDIERVVPDTEDRGAVPNARRDYDVLNDRLAGREFMVGHICTIGEHLGLGLARPGLARNGGRG
jgi:hypothetical protein